MSETMTRACPFCGDVRPASIAELPMQFDPPNVFYAACQCCGAQGPYASTRGAAIIMWDQRRASGDTKEFCALADRLAGIPQTPEEIAACNLRGGDLL